MSFPALSDSPWFKVDLRTTLSKTERQTVASIFHVDGSNPVHPMRALQSRLSLISLIFATAFFAACVSSKRVPISYLITEHGAVGDGATVNTKVIQSTI